MNIALVTTIHERPALTRLMLGYYAGLECLSVRVAAMSFLSGPCDDYESWQGVYAPNSPLSDKHNAAFALLKDVDHDAACITGSDDFIHPEYFERASHLIEEGADIVYPQELVFFSAQSGRAFLGQCGRGGPGRMLSRRVLEQLNYAPYVPGQDRAMEGAMNGKIRGMRHLREAFVKPGEVPPTLCVKDAGAQMWTYEHYLGVMAQSLIEPAVFLTTHYPTISSDLLTWQQT